MNPANPWKPCDLRGVYPDAVNEDLFARVAQAIALELASGTHVVVGGDFRCSTPSLKSALIESLARSGLHVIDVGQAPTPIVYFHSRRVSAAAVFIVTASHNPAVHNGLKWMVHELPPSPEDISRIRAAAESAKFSSGHGSIESADPVSAYLEWILSQFRGARAQRVVLDAGNGAWSHLALRIFRDLGFEATALHCEPDGNFPRRPPDCARTVNLTSLRVAAREQNAIGIAWDGDGDRVAFVDETGEHVSTDEISILFARDALRRGTPAENVVCDIKLSDAVRREVIEAGGIPLIERSGHAFMRSRILSTRAILGLDACGHYFFREAGWRDDGVYSALSMLRILDGSTLNERRRAVPPIHGTPELRLPASILDLATILNRLRGAFPAAKESNLDGALLLLDEGLILVRESSTEPVVSLRIEGFSAVAFHKLTAHCLASLEEVAAMLQAQMEHS